MQTALQFEDHLEKQRTDQSLPNALPGLSPMTCSIVQDDASSAEGQLLDLADYVYAHTPLKPMSKAIFFISRCLLLARRGLNGDSHDAIAESYKRICSSLGDDAPTDDFDFSAVLSECRVHLRHIIRAVKRVASLTSGTDSLGLAFNTLLRGKFESGEGLGTFLTPEEVVDPMVRMALGVVEPRLLKNMASSSRESLLFGDICGGTGRFVYCAHRVLQENGLQSAIAQRAARLFDQSSLAVELGRLNFLFDDIAPKFTCVGDSLTSASVSKLAGSFALLATNPPFGVGKYRWSPELSSALPVGLLQAMGLKRDGDAADPSELFLFRNLDLLAPGGALAIVLPDGIVQGRELVDLLRAYERLRSVSVSIAAIVSLPVVTFSLGGTVAKTSFLILRKNPAESDLPLYVAIAKHVGFVKRGNRRVSDPEGNDLIQIAREFLGSKPSRGVVVDSWRPFERLVPAAICHIGTVRDDCCEQDLAPLRRFVQVVKDFETISPRSGTQHFHISVLDVDETGLINIIAASENRPVTRGLSCKPGDIILSCINPKIWRVALIPNIGGQWTCSPEFLVLRPKSPEQAWPIYFSLHLGSVISRVQAMAGGTSSSRQRVEKEQLLDLDVSVKPLPRETVEVHALKRVEYYTLRLEEAEAYSAMHERDADFSAHSSERAHSSSTKASG